MNRKELIGSKKVTCREATRLLNERKVFKAYFRPGMDQGPYSDDDPAYVWTEDEKPTHHIAEGAA